MAPHLLASRKKKKQGSSMNKTVLTVEQSTASSSSNKTLQRLAMTNNDLILQQSRPSLHHVSNYDPQQQHDSGHAHRTSHNDNGGKHGTSVTNSNGSSTGSCTSSSHGMGLSSSDSSAISRSPSHPSRSDLHTKKKKERLMNRPMTANHHTSPPHNKREVVRHGHYRRHPNQHDNSKQNDRPPEQRSDPLLRSSPNSKNHTMSGNHHRPSRRSPTSTSASASKTGSALWDGIHESPSPSPSPKQHKPPTANNTKQTLISVLRNSMNYTPNNATTARSPSKQLGTIGEDKNHQDEPDWDDYEYEYDDDDDDDDDSRGHCHQHHINQSNRYGLTPKGIRQIRASLFDPNNSTVALQASATRTAPSCANNNTTPSSSTNDTKSSSSSLVARLPSTPKRPTTIGKSPSSDSPKGVTELFTSATPSTTTTTVQNKPTPSSSPRNSPSKKQLASEKKYTDEARKLLEGVVADPYIMGDSNNALHHTVLTNNDDDDTHSLREEQVHLAYNYALQARRLLDVLGDDPAAVGAAAATGAAHKKKNNPTSKKNNTPKTTRDTTKPKGGPLSFLFKGHKNGKSRAKSMPPSGTIVEEDKEADCYTEYIFDTQKKTKKRMTFHKPNMKRKNNNSMIVTNNVNCEEILQQRTFDTVEGRVAVAGGGANMSVSDSMARRMEKALRAKECANIKQVTLPLNNRNDITTSADEVSALTLTSDVRQVNDWVDELNILFPRKFLETVVEFPETVFQSAKEFLFPLHDCANGCAGRTYDTTTTTVPDITITRKPSLAETPKRVTSKDKDDKAIPRDQDGDDILQDLKTWSV